MQPSAQISLNGQELAHSNANSVEESDYTIAWDGFLYDADGTPHHAAVRRLLDRLRRGESLISLCGSLRGSFFVAIWDKQKQQGHAFVDENGLYSAYRNRYSVAKSFLHLLDDTTRQACPLNSESVVEFLQMGNVYFGHTLSDEIRKISQRELLKVDREGVSVDKRIVPEINDPPVYANLFDAMEPVAEAAKQCTPSVDLTGGFDSRLVACLMTHHQVPFEAALSGESDHPDCVLGQQVAEALGCKFVFTTWNTDRLEADLPGLMSRLDGMCGYLSTFHRLCQLTDERQSRGIDLSFKGSGGELFKDFFWAQDFPFYASKKSRLNRLHRLRLEFELLSPNVLTEEFFGHFLSARKKRQQRLQEYSLPLNTQTYDNVYFNERVQTWNGRLITSCQAPTIASHSPLCETRAVQIGFSAARSLRFYNRLHRHYISKQSPAAAQVYTTDGTTASDRTADLLRDGAGYAYGKSRKLLRKLNQLLLNRTRFEASTFSATDRILNTDLAVASLHALKSAGIVQEPVEYSDISPRFREFFFAMGWLLDRSSALKIEAPTTKQ